MSVNNKIEFKCTILIRTKIPGNLLLVSERKYTKFISFTENFNRKNKILNLAGHLIMESLSFKTKDLQITVSTFDVAPSQPSSSPVRSQDVICCTQKSIQISRLQL